MASESRRLIEKPTKYGRVLHKLNQAFGTWTFEDYQEHDRGNTGGTKNGRGWT